MKNEYPEWHKTQFDDLKKCHNLWFLKADRLSRSSEICWTQFLESQMEFFEMVQENPNVPYDIHVDLGLSDISYFLLGLAFENLIKGIYQKETGDYPELTHKTTDLVEKIDTRLTPTEAEYLATLSDIVFWRGRYPLPKHKKHFDLLPIETGGWKFPAELSTKDREPVMALYGKLARYLKKIELGNGEVRETPAENLIEQAMNKAVFPAPHRKRYV